jgi:transcriptional regulator with XRE-family HTH domain
MAAASDRVVEDKAAKLIEQIGKRVAELRRNAGWSQKDFAEVLNTSVQWVSLVETGRQNLTVHTLVRLAHKLRVDVLELWKVPREEPKPARAGRGRPRKRK